MLWALLLVLLLSPGLSAEPDLLLVTVATEPTDGYQRSMRSARVYNHTVKVLRMGEAWQGGKMTEAGGGHKVNLLRDELQRHDPDQLILFTDSYDVVVTAGAEVITERFSRLGGRVVFGAEDFCWPDASLASQYPRVSFGYKYLNSGGFMGYAGDLLQLVSVRSIAHTQDDQLHYTQLFLDQGLRDKHKIKLDTQALIFQNLNGQSGDVSLKFEEEDVRLENTVYHTVPAVVHGNGPAKVVLNSLGNYLAKSWTYGAGCVACAEGHVNLSDLKDEEQAVVVVAVFVEKATPFLEEMLQKVASLKYPKHRIHLLLHNQVELHNKVVEDWAHSQEKSGEYASVTTLPVSLKEWHARNQAVERCLAVECGAMFSVDGEVHLDNPDTLSLLLSHNRTILAAIMVREGQAWSTFWGAINQDGFYARSADYMDIVNGERRGIWNVPYVSGVYVVLARGLVDPSTRPYYIHNLLDADMAMASNLRDKGVFMYASNMESYGHLVDPDYFPTKYLHNDMWQMKANRKDWEARYIHPQYWTALSPSHLNHMPCPDVYWFPVFTKRFCVELVQQADSNGGWSDGSNKDPRLAGGYENVPTVDIHMNQMEFEQEWLWILKYYIKPLAEKVYLGYESDARAIMNFIVRYRPTEQSFLRPHHDSSTYTINVGLNHPGIDYEGGGARFIRYNCSVTATRVGWALMHPGRLTHYHEGLPTTNGTRYIMVSFIDP